MDDAFHVAASGMTAVARLLEISAANAAHARTPGYQNGVLATHSFQTALDRAQGRPAELIGTSESVGFRPGNVVSTGKPLDVALMGPGFLSVQTPAKVAYTRNGSLTISPDGTLVTQAGYPVLGTSGPIHMDLEAGQNLRIAEGGAVFQGPLQVGSLKLTEFQHKDRLQRAGDTLFTAPQAAGAMRASRTRLVPKHLELPPEHSLTAMVQMIEASKSFEAQQRVIRNLSQSYQNLIRLGR